MKEYIIFDRMVGEKKWVDQRVYFDSLKEAERHVDDLRREDEDKRFEFEYEIAKVGEIQSWIYTWG